MTGAPSVPGRPRPPIARLVAFTSTLLAFSLPFWVVGAVAKAQLLPGLPLSALMAGCPGLVALFLTRSRAQRHTLVRRLVRPTRGVWLVLAGLLPPVSLAASALVMLARGDLLTLTPAGPLVVAGLAATFVVAAAAEELGWTAYLTAPILHRHGVLRTGLLLGVVWAAWHFIPYLQGGRSLSWIAWQSLKTVAARVVMVRLYAASRGRAAPAILLHASDNLSIFLFPVWGSGYEPQLAAAAFSVLAAAAVATPRGWRIGTLG